MKRRGQDTRTVSPKKKVTKKRSNSASADERIAKSTFSAIYPLYVSKIEKKGRSEDELRKIIEWLTSFDEFKLKSLIDDKVTFEEFFEQATLQPDAHLITGVICGHRVEDIENPLTQKVRYLDKVVDELAKGWELDKIMRKPK